MAMGTYIGAGSVKTPSGIYVGAGGVKTCSAIYVGAGGVKQVWPMWSTGYGIMSSDCPSWKSVGGTSITNETALGTSGSYLTLTSAYTNGTAAAHFVTTSAIPLTSSSVLLIDEPRLDESNWQGVTSSGGSRDGKCYAYIGLDTSQKTNQSYKNCAYYGSTSSNFNMLRYGADGGTHSYALISLGFSFPDGNYYIHFGIGCATGAYNTVTYYFRYGVRLFNSESEVTYEQSTYDSTGTTTVSIKAS